MKEKVIVVVAINQGVQHLYSVDAERIYALDIYVIIGSVCFGSPQNITILLPKVHVLVKSLILLIMHC